MTERSRTHSPAGVSYSYGAFALASAAMALAILLLPIDIWSRAALLVGALMTVHLSISMTKMLRTKSESKVLVRNSGAARKEKPRGTASGNGYFY